MSEASNREILLRTASRLFRQKGYDGVGLNEILVASKLPKGSLYYHFPGGKRELAEAATLFAGEMVERIVDEVFSNAGDFTEGAVRLCRAIAEMVVQQDEVLSCPIVSVLQAGAQDERLRAIGRNVLAIWATCLVKHATRLGHPAPDQAAELLIMQLEGAWILALAEQCGAPIERLAHWLGMKGGPANS